MDSEKCDNCKAPARDCTNLIGNFGMEGSSAVCRGNQSTLFSFLVGCFHAHYWLGGNHQSGGPRLSGTLGMDGCSAAG